MSGRLSGRWTISCLFLALVANENGNGDLEANTFNTTDVHGRFLPRLGRDVRK